MSLFCGHMSGVNWLPGWAADQSAASTFAGHGGLAGWDLGNEFSNLR